MLFELHKRVVDLMLTSIEALLEENSARVPLAGEGSEQTG